MEQHHKNFLEFNGRNIYTLANDGISYVALKPICEALNVNWQAAHKRLLEDKILSELSSEQTIVAADNKLRKMSCLPERYVYGWLFSLNSQSEELEAYKLKCYDLLYDYFHGSMTARLTELRVKSDAEIKIEQLKAALLETPEYKELQLAEAVVKNQGKVLKQLDRELQKGQTNLFGMNQN